MTGASEDVEILRAYSAARRSWFWPLMVMVFGSLLTKIWPRLAITQTAGALILLCIFAGSFCAAIVALTRVPAVGRRSIRSHAIAGILLNGVFLGGFVAMLLRKWL